MLVNKPWKILIFPGKNHQNGGFSMAMLVYRSVVSVESFFVTRWHLDWGHLKKNIDFTRGLIWYCKGTTSFLKIYSGLEIFSTEFLARLKMQWFFSTKLWNCWKISVVFFQIEFLNFTWGNDPIWRAYFSGVKPPTRNCLPISVGSPVDQTKWLVFRMIHVKDSRSYQWASRLVDVDFLGILVCLKSTWNSFGGKPDGSDFERPNFFLRVRDDTGTIHAGWNNDSTLLGRTLDLTAAYKQLAVSPSQGFVRVMVAYDPVRSKRAFFVFNALPFGATGSVYSFNRVAKSLWHIMVSLGGVWATQYYDDFPNIELQRLADNSRSFMEFILEALGWRFASEGPKLSGYRTKWRV